MDRGWIEVEIFQTNIQNQSQCIDDDGTNDDNKFRIQISVENYFKNYNHKYIK